MTLSAFSKFLRKYLTPSATDYVGGYGDLTGTFICRDPSWISNEPISWTRHIKDNFYVFFASERFLNYIKTGSKMVEILIIYQIKPNQIFPFKSSNTTTDLANQATMAPPFLLHIKNFGVH